jgi:hypothetical protein
MLEDQHGWIGLPSPFVFTKGNDLAIRARRPPSGEPVGKCRRANDQEAPAQPPHAQLAALVRVEG